MGNEPRSRKKQLSLIALAIPFGTLGVEWVEEGFFASLVSPHLHRLELVQWIPKLGRDLDAIAYHHFHYPPDPYLYWYAVTLGLVTGFAILFIPAMLNEITREGWRDSPGARQTEDLLTSGWKRLFALAGIAMFLLWPWIGLSILTPGMRFSMSPGLLHDLFTALFFVLYAGAVACGPALIKFVMLRRRERN